MRMKETKAGLPRAASRASPSRLASHTWLHEHSNVFSYLRRGVPISCLSEWQWLEWCRNDRPWWIESIFVSPMKLLLGGIITRMRCPISMCLLGTMPECCCVNRPPSASIDGIPFVVRRKRRGRDATKDEESPLKSKRIREAVTIYWWLEQTGEGVHARATGRKACRYIQPVNDPLWRHRRGKIRQVPRPPLSWPQLFTSRTGWSRKTDSDWLEGQKRRHVGSSIVHKKKQKKTIRQHIFEYHWLIFLWRYAIYYR